MELLKISLIIIFLLDILAKVKSNFQEEKNGTSSIDNLESENDNLGNHEKHRRLTTIQKGAEDFNNLEMAQEETRNMDESHEKILKFGKRVLESVNKHGILEKETHELKSGNFRIDWWKNDRRLERIRKRLSEALAKQPELKNHLIALGWRNTSEKNFQETEKILDHTSVKKPSTNSGNDPKILKTMMAALEDLLNFDSTKFEEETMSKEPAIFVYMKIMIPKLKKMEQHEITTPDAISDSPITYNLNTEEQQDFGQSDVNSNDVKNEGIQISNSMPSPTSSINMSGQTIDTDRLLQLIPLIVHELRNDCLSNEERCALSWIFGKRLWQLLEREALKKSDETMEKDLAMFLIKGELTDRDIELARRKRRRPTRSMSDDKKERKIFQRSVIDEDYLLDERVIDRDFKTEDENDNEKSLKGSSPNNYHFNNNNNDDDDDDDAETSDEVSFEELLDIAAKFQSRMLEEKKRKHENEKNKKRKNPKKWMSDYENYDYENYDY